MGYKTKDKHGNKLVLWVKKSIPGIQCAGRLWCELFTKFFLDGGFTQSSVDRRMFYKFDGTKFIMVAVYVDDSWFISTCKALVNDFVKRWQARFDYASDVEDTAGEFCGATIERHDDGSVTVFGGRIYDDLKAKLRLYSIPTGFTIEYPMAEDGLRVLRAPVTKKNPEESEELKSVARSITGLAGWIACNLRPGAYFAFIAITQRLAHHFTRNVWHSILRWAFYLVAQ